MKPEDIALIVGVVCLIASLALLVHGRYLNRKFLNDIDRINKKHRDIINSWEKDKVEAIYKIKQALND
ncbi:hypothetical protein [Sphingobacterium kyonggiense]